MDKYQDRQEAGSILAQHLGAYANRDNVMVLALPRGGVPVGYEIAKALHAPLDVFIVRKLGVPGHEELAMGAIAMGGVQVLNQDIIAHLQVTPLEIKVITEREQQELQRREKAYRGNKAFPALNDKIVILVDDGIATGATMRAAIKALRHLSAGRIVVAVPVAEKQTCREMQAEVDEFICPLQPVNFYAVGAWYEEFEQTEDEEVHRLLKQANKDKKHG